MRDPAAVVKNGLNSRVISFLQLLLWIDSGLPDISVSIISEIRFASSEFVEAVNRSRRTLGDRNFKNSKNNNSESVTSVSAGLLLVSLER